jgi:hypothetical protein
MSSDMGLEPQVAEALKALGVDVSACAEGSKGARVVVVQTSMEEAVKALGRGGRDQVVMTRIDQATAQALDRWVDAGVARSRSEAAAVFLQEGLKLRQAELEELSGALEALEAARETLRKKAQAVMGKKEA